jgi:flagellar motor protein MotB
MYSTPNPKQPDTHDVLVARVDEKFASAHEQIVRADEELARVQEKLSNLTYDPERGPSDPQMTPFRHAAVNDIKVLGGRRSLGGPALRGAIGLMLAACIGVAAIGWQSSYGDAARLMIAQWAPQVLATSSPPPEKPGLPAQPSPPAVQAAAVEAAPPQPAPPQPAPPAQTAPEAVAPTAATPTAATLSPEVTQMLQTMARDLATVEQGLEQLKASQEQITQQIARDNAKVAEQLKASQEQMARVITRASEQNPRPKTSPPPPRPIAAAPARKRVPKPPPPQATVRPQDESRLPADDQQF